MGISDIFKSKNAEPNALNYQPTVPLIQSTVADVGGEINEMAKLRNMNKYDLADVLISTDERIWGIVELVGIMCFKAFAGVGIRSEDPGDDELTTREATVIKSAKKFVEDLELQEIYYNHGKKLISYGDIVEKIHKDKNNGVTFLEPLPMSRITAIAKKEDLNKNDTDQVVRKANFYVIGENNSGTTFQQMDSPSMPSGEGKPVLIAADEIFHLSIDKRNTWVKDLIGRDTFGIWSESPLKPIVALVQWKKNIIRNDMLWRDKLIPRYLHELPMGMYDMSRYTGTPEEKQTKAIAAAKQAITNYSADLNSKMKQADQGIVVPEGIKITVLESMNKYSEPNAMLDQIDSKLSSQTGTPSALVGGDSKGFTSLIQSTSFLSMRAEVYTIKITKTWEKILRQHLTILHPGIGKDVIDRVYLKTKLILERDRNELAQIVSILAGTKAFTTSDLREVMGKEPLTQKEKDSIKEWVEDTNPKSDNVSSSKSVTDDAKKKKTDSATTGQESAQKRDNDRNSTGENAGTGSRK